MDLLSDLPDGAFQRVLDGLSSRDVANVARAGPRTAAMVHPASYKHIALSKTIGAQRTADALRGGACESLTIEHDEQDPHSTTSALYAVLGLAATRPEAVRRIESITLRSVYDDVGDVSAALPAFLSPLFPALRRLVVDGGILASRDVPALADARLECDRAVLRATDLPALGGRHVRHVKVELDTVESDAFRLAAANGLRIDTLTITDIDEVDDLTRERTLQIYAQIKRIASNVRVVYLTGSTPHLRFLYACCEAGGASAKLTVHTTGPDRFWLGLMDPA